MKEVKILLFFIARPFAQGLLKFISSFPQATNPRREEAEILCSARFGNHALRLFFCLNTDLPRSTNKVGAGSSNFYNLRSPRREACIRPIRKESSRRVASLGKAGSLAK
ncbi:MAG: hypothetical protein HYX24_05630 [Candidatus Aenigmarchaeota archaeon]|nr:hypothetical protein [Candidatus Aenigmarchaeota archaeon]